MAEDCTIARPYFGSVNCLESSWSKNYEVSDEQTWTCETENCEIIGLTPNDVTCTGLGFTSRLVVKDELGTKIVDCDSTVHPLGDKCTDDISAHAVMHKEDKITVDFSCNMGAQPEGNPRVLVHYKKLELFKNVDSASNIPVPNSEFCNFNSQWDEYSKQLSNNEVLNSVTLSSNSEFSGGKGSSNIPSSMSSVSLAPSQLGYMDAYWFIYDWVERPGLIMGSFENKDVWCNPIDHSLTKLEEIKTIGSKCYLIPTTRLQNTVECCSSDECKGKYQNQGIFCTNDFKCGFEKSCNSDLDCGGQAEKCQEESGKYYLVSSSCDKSELDNYGKGSCISDKREVKCCAGNDGGPDNCGSGKYCDYEKGCNDVSYKSSQGEIKTGVGTESIKEESTSGITGNVIGIGGKGSSLIIGLVILVLIGAGLAVYFLKKKKGPAETLNSNCCEESRKAGKKFCVTCGKELIEAQKNKKNN